MPTVTSLSFREDMVKNLNKIADGLGGVLDGLDLVEDAATEVENALDSIDDSSILELDDSMVDAMRQADRLARELDGVDQSTQGIGGQQVGRLERALRDAAKAGDEAADSLSHVEDAAGQLETLAGVAAGAGAVLTFGLGAAAHQSYEMNAATKMLKGRLSETDHAASGLEEAVRSVYTAGLVETPQEAAEAYGRFAHLLEGTSEEMTKVAQGAIALEKQSLGDLDQDSIAKALNMMEGQWGTGPVQGLDMISKVYGRVGDQADDLLDTIWEYSPQFKEAGISAEKMMGMLAAGMDGGAFNFDKLGDAFKESFGIRLNKALDENALGSLEGIFGEEKLFKLIDQIKAGGSEAEEAITTITAGIAALEDAGERDDALVNIFGTQYEDAGRKAIEAMMSAGPLEDFEGKTQEVIDNTTSEWLAMTNEMKSSFEPVGDVVLDLALPIMSFLASMAQGIGNFAEQHPTLTKIAVVFLAILSALLLIAAPILLIITLIPAVSAGFAALTAIMGGFGIASLSALWPILLIIAAVVAVIAIVWLLYDNWEMIWAGIVAATQVVVAVLKGLFTAFTQYLTGDWGGAWETIKTTFFNAFTTIDGWFNGWISGLFDSGRKIILTIVDGILSVKDKVADALSSAFEWADKFLPHSDADMGPFSRLTDSGMAIPETLAIGVEAADDTLSYAMSDTFASVPLDPQYSAPSYAPSFQPAIASAAASGSGDTNNTQTIVLRNNFNVTAPAGGSGTSEQQAGLQELGEQLAGLIADNLQHILAGKGQVVLE